MVAYSFKARFAPLIASGRKTQTIRGHRKRHARPGEPLQLYTGMRTRSCRKLLDSDPVCLRVSEITLDVPPDTGVALVMGESDTFAPVSPSFAIADGFQDPEDFTRFWREAHGPGLFRGIMIEWSAPSRCVTPA